VIDEVKPDERQLYGRFGALHIETCKAFDEPWSVAAPRLPLLGSYMDCNYDADSIQWAGQQLLSQRARRRVMMVLSDGNPNTSEPPIQRARQQAHLPHVIAAMGKQGIEIVGIGICDDSVTKYYPRSLVIHNAMGLPKAVMTEMDFLLLNRRNARR
jgi:cobalamin biosynthesis protein CobT